MSRQYLILEDQMKKLRAENEELKVFIGCLNAAGIDNCEAYSIGCQEFYEQYPDSNI